MLWNTNTLYLREEFGLESELEEAVKEVAFPLFGANRYYIDVKKRIARKEGRFNVPDGYLIDLVSKREPKLFVVENELASHEPLKHIAVQILEFSLAFETSPQRVKEVLKDALKGEPRIFEHCDRYARENGFENVDVLLERLIYPTDSFNALVVIDEVSEELERALLSRFKFPVEIVTLQRFVDSNGARLYEFEPFLDEIDGTSPTLDDRKNGSNKIDPSEINTIVVPAHDEGFNEVFLGEDRWYKIRIHSSMIPRIEYIAVYRVAPISAITHIAKVHDIQQWPNTNKYVVNFEEKAQKIGPIKLVQGGMVRAPQAPRYTSIERLESAKNLDEAF